MFLWNFEIGWCEDVKCEHVKSKDVKRAPDGRLRAIPFPRLNLVISCCKLNGFKRNVKCNRLLRMLWSEAVKCPFTLSHTQGLQACGVPPLRPAHIGPRFIGIYLKAVKLWSCEAVTCKLLIVRLWTLRGGRMEMITKLEGLDKRNIMWDHKIHRCEFQRDSNVESGWYC